MAEYASSAADSAAESVLMAVTTSSGHGGIPGIAEDDTSPAMSLGLHHRVLMNYCSGGWIPLGPGAGSTLVLYASPVHETPACGSR